MIKLTVSSEQARQRLDRVLAESLPAFSRARLQTLIRDGFVLLNGKPPRPRDLVRTGDVVELREPELEKVEAQPEQIKLDVIFEDDDLLVLNKPAGIVMHPGAGHQAHTLVNALLAHCQNLSGIGGKERPGIVHRLDKETSGVLVVAKNDATHRDLSKQFAARTMTKIYLALVAGILRKTSGVIDKAIARHPVHRQRMSIARRQGRSAKTEYRVLRSGDEISLVECILHSGRTHPDPGALASPRPSCSGRQLTSWWQTRRRFFSSNAARVEARVSSSAFRRRDEPRSTCSARLPRCSDATDSEVLTQISHQGHNGRCSLLPIHQALVYLTS